MSPDKIIRALDAEAKAHDVFSLVVVLAERNGEPRSDMLVYHDEKNRTDKIQSAIDGGLVPVGLLAIIRARTGSCAGSGAFTNEPWAIRILQSARLEMSTLVSASAWSHQVAGTDLIC